MTITPAVRRHMAALARLGAERMGAEGRRARARAGGLASQAAGRVRRAAAGAAAVPGQSDKIPDKRQVDLQGVTEMGKTVSDNPTV